MRCCFAAVHNSAYVCDIARSRADFRFRCKTDPAAQQSPAIAEVCYPFGRKHGRYWPVRRREFITLVGGAAVAWPLGAWAQQPTMPTIGFLSSLAQSDLGLVIPGFQQGLNGAGLVEGQNIAIEYRWAE